MSNIELSEEKRLIILIIIMVEKTEHHITLHYDKEGAQSLDPATKLHQAYWVWALVKNQGGNAAPIDGEQYVHDNQLIAKFHTVEEFWQV